MKSIMSYAFLFLLLLLAGCGNSDQKAAISEMLDYMNEMTDILETVQNESSAALAMPKLEMLEKKMEAASVKMAQSFTGRNPQEMQSLMMDFQEQLADAGQRFATELMRVTCISGVGEDFQEMFKATNSGST